MKAALVLTLVLLPFGAFGGVYTCVENGKITYSDQVCGKSAENGSEPVVRPKPRANPLRLASIKPEESPKSDKIARRKALERRMRAADDELMWLYRERRAAADAHMADRLAEAGDAGLSEAERAQERKAFEANYENSIKILRREINTRRRQLEDPNGSFHKTAYAAR